MKNIIKSIVVRLYSLIKPNKNTILILESAYPSGSNTKAIYDKKELFEDAGYTITVMPYEDVRVVGGGLVNYFKHIIIMKDVSKYEYIFVTHSFQKYNKQQTLIDFWHGIPLKAMKFMEDDLKEATRVQSNADVLVTSSKMESVLMGASFHIPFINHKILGSPRNDYLFEKVDDLGTLDFIRNYHKVLIYLPTFRQGYFDRTEGIDYGTLFNMEVFDDQAFIKMLKKNDILLITKYHPREVEYKNINYSIQDNIFNLTNEDLVRNDLDLYQILPETDMLVTDYSSVYFDYLLLDKPIVFTPTDLESYKNARGLVLEPYDQWTPGPKCLTQESLEEVITKSTFDEHYLKEKAQLKQVFHERSKGNAISSLLTYLTGQ